MKPTCFFSLIYKQANNYTHTHYTHISGHLKNEDTVLLETGGSEVLQEVERPRYVVREGRGGTMKRRLSESEANVFSETEADLFAVFWLMR